MHTSPSNKRYIGITSRTIKDRWHGGYGYKTSICFNNAVKKYGWENFKHEVLYDNLTYEEACKKEIELIAKYKTQQREFGYNISKGGGGRSAPFSEKTIEKLRKSHLGHKLSEETKRRQSESHKKRYREHPMTEETKRKISEKQKGKKISDETIMKCRLTKAGRTYNLKGRRKCSEEQKRYLSEINKGKLSPKARKVICLDTLEVFDAIVDAAERTGCSKSGINGVCMGRHYTTNGIMFAYYDPLKSLNYYKELKIRRTEEKKKSFQSEEHRKKILLSVKKPVICVETSIMYESIKDASEKTGINNNSIGRCCKGGAYTAGGFHWRYAN